MSCEIAIGHPYYHPLYLARLSSCEELILALTPLHLAQLRYKSLAVVACIWCRKPPTWLW